MNHSSEIILIVKEEPINDIEVSNDLEFPDTDALDEESLEGPSNDSIDEGPSKALIEESSAEPAVGDAPLEKQKELKRKGAYSF